MFVAGVDGCRATQILAQMSKGSNSLAVNQSAPEPRLNSIEVLRSVNKPLLI